MNFTEYKFDPDWVAAEVAKKRENIKANLGEGADLLKNGLKVIVGRLAKDPMRYRDYGPYWWALKALLNVHGHSYGSNDNVLMRDAYHGKTPVETLVMAELFRDDYLQTCLIYNNQFMLSADSVEITVIVDGDMEGR
ncbi:MAG: hypothetical protein M0Q44_01590 [Methylobacter sp.]|nr:hypothetical protein [Methylobacter sp.]